MSEETLEAPVLESTSTAGAPEAPPAESGQPAQNDAESAPAKTEPAPGEGKNRLQRKLDRAFRERAEAQVRAQFFEQQLKEFQAKANAPKDDGAPRLEDFDDVQKFADAVAEHKLQRASKESESRRQQQASAIEGQRLIEGWESRASKATQDDFDEVVGDLKPTTPWAVAIMEADNGPEIAYHLGTHLEEAKAIAAMSPSAQIRAIGRLEAKLAAEPTKPPPTSKAPAPISALSGSGTGMAATDPGTESMEAFMKRRNKELGRK